MRTERDRVISVSLSEAEWQAFVARHPQPVMWLRDRIREEMRPADFEDYCEDESAEARQLT